MSDNAVTLLGATVLPDGHVRLNFSCSIRQPGITDSLYCRQAERLVSREDATTRSLITQLYQDVAAINHLIVQASALELTLTTKASSQLLEAITSAVCKALTRPIVPPMPRELQLVAA